MAEQGGTIFSDMAEAAEGALARAVIDFLLVAFAVAIVVGFVVSVGVSAYRGHRWRRRQHEIGLAYLREMQDADDKRRERQHEEWRRMRGH